MSSVRPVFTFSRRYSFFQKARGGMRMRELRRTGGGNSDGSSGSCGSAADESLSSGSSGITRTEGTVALRRLLFAGAFAGCGADGASLSPSTFVFSSFTFSCSCCLTSSSTTTPFSFLLSTITPFSLSLSIDTSDGCCANSLSAPHSPMRAFQSWGIPFWKASHTSCWKPLAALFFASSSPIRM